MYVSDLRTLWKFDISRYLETYLYFTTNCVLKRLYELKNINSIKLALLLIDATNLKHR